MNLESAGDAPKVSMTHTVAVYEPSGGRVVHLHHVVVFGGAKNIRVEEAEGEAIDNARRRGWNSKELRTLHVTELVPPHAACSASIWSPGSWYRRSDTRLG